MLAILLVAANLLKERARRNLNRALFRCVIAPCPALFASSKPRWRWPRRLAWCCRCAEFRRRYLQRTSFRVYIQKSGESVGDGKVVPRATAALAKAKTIPPCNTFMTSGQFPARSGKSAGRPTTTEEHGPYRSLSRARYGTNLGGFSSASKTQIRRSP